MISNVIENGVAIGALGAGEASWHTDMSFLPDPPLGSVLYSLEVPPSGGDTWFLNMVMAYQALPADLRARVDGLSLKHDSTTNSGGFLRHGYERPTDLATSPGTVHPLVITHPESGDRALYLGRRLNAYVVGLPIEEGKRCSTSCGATSPSRNSPGRIPGARAIWSCGTTASPCTAATASTTSTAA